MFEGASGGGCHGGCCREADMVLDIKNWRVGKGSWNKARKVRAGLKRFWKDSGSTVGAVIRNAITSSDHS